MLQYLSASQIDLWVMELHAFVKSTVAVHILTLTRDIPAQSSCALQHCLLSGWMFCCCFYCCFYSFDAAAFAAAFGPLTAELLHDGPENSKRAIWRAPAC